MRTLPTWNVRIASGLGASIRSVPSNPATMPASRGEPASPRPVVSISVSSTVNCWAARLRTITLNSYCPGSRGTLSWYAKGDAWTSRTCVGVSSR